MKQKRHLGVIHDAILATYAAKTASLFSAGQKKSPVNFGAAVSGVVVLDCNTNTGLI